MKRSLVAAMAAAVLLVAVAAAQAADDPWKLLGTRKVTDRVERDMVDVGVRRGEFTAVQIRVEKVAVQFREVTIHFVNGKRQTVALRDVIPAGGQSRVIDLAGADRHIRAVELVYDSQSLGRRGTVRVWGRR
jgi:hypothetical protein